MNFLHPHPSAPGTLDCQVCSKYARQFGPDLVVYYHLSVCRDDASSPSDPEFPFALLPEVSRMTPGNDLYRKLLDNLDDKMLAISGEDEGEKVRPTGDFANVYRRKFAILARCKIPEQEDIVRAFAAAARKRRKEYVDLAMFRDAKRLSEIQRLLCQCRYPEDEDSPSGKRFLPLLLLRRAALLVKKPAPDLDYAAVLADLELLETRWSDLLPSSERHNLNYVKTLCRIKLRLYADARASLEEAIEALEDSNLEESLRVKRRDKLDKGRETIVKNGAANLGVTPASPEIPRLRRNLSHPALSAKVEVVSDRPAEFLGPKDVKKKEPCLAEHLRQRKLSIAVTKRRGVFARETVEPGEIVAVDSPILYSLRNDLMHVAHTRCHHCLIESRHLLPCPHCCLVMFCTIKCRDDAVDTYHRYECEIGLSLLSLALGSSFCLQVQLTLRLLFSHPLEHWLKHEDVFLRQNTNSKEAADAVYREDDWSRFWQLETRYSTKKEPDVLGCFASDNITVITLHAMHLIKSSGYLQQQQQKGAAEEKLIRILAHSIRVAKFNGVALGESEPKLFLTPAHPANAKAIQFSVYGQAISNTASLFNHSCVRNAVRFPCHGTKSAAIVSTKRIEKGEEIFLSYTFAAVKLESAIRNHLLMSEFGIWCSCRGCASEWGSRQPETMPGLSETDFAQVMEFMTLLKEKRFEDLMKSRFAIYEETMEKLPTESDRVWWEDSLCHYFLLPIYLKYCVRMAW